MPLTASATPHRGRARLRALAGVATLSLTLGTLALGTSPAEAGGNHKDDHKHGHHHQPKAQLVELQLLAFNDYHGHLQASTPGGVSVPPGSAAQAAGGSQYLSAALKDLRKGNKYSLTVAAGDLIGGSPAFSGLFHDEPSVESLNAMKLDVSGVGNHEFDEGVTELLRMQDGGCHPVDGCYFADQPFEGANFRWLAANVVSEKTGKTPLPPTWVKKINSVKVGFIGMTLEGTDALVAAEGIQGYKFLDEVRTANQQVHKLKKQGVETIVVLLHEGATQEPAPGDINACNNISGPIVDINSGLDNEIDVVVTGHTHQPYNCMLPGPQGKLRMVTSAYSYGRVVSELNLVIDKKSGEVRRDLSTATNHPVIQSELTPDPALTAVINKWQPVYDEFGNTPVGTITADINRGGIPATEDRGVESAAGNLVADAQLSATSLFGADIAFMNPGGLRSDLTYAQSQTPAEGDGVVTFGEAFTFQPFGNVLATFPMTGAQIKSVLEEQCQPAGSSRNFQHLGVSDGFTYSLSKTFAEGDCTAVSVTDVELHGVPLDDATTYLVTTSTFLADGGDHFSTFATLDPSDRVYGGDDLDALNDYLGTNSPVAPPSTDRVTELP